MGRRGCRRRFLGRGSGSRTPPPNGLSARPGVCGKAWSVVNVVRLSFVRKRIKDPSLNSYRYESSHVPIFPFVTANPLVASVLQDAVVHEHVLNLFLMVVVLFDVVVLQQSAAIHSIVVVNQRRSFCVASSWRGWKKGTKRMYTFGWA